MRGKGQSIVNFDGTNSSDADGEITGYEWDFGDDSDIALGAAVTHAYNTIGKYTATLTATDNFGATGQDTAEATTVGPTPPATGCSRWRPSRPC